MQITSTLLSFSGRYNAKTFAAALSDGNPSTGAPKSRIDALKKELTDNPKESVYWKLVARFPELQYIEIPKTKNSKKINTFVNQVEKAIGGKTADIDQISKDSSFSF